MFDIKEIPQIPNIGQWESSHTTSERGADSPRAYARAIFDKKDGFLTPGFFGRLRLYGGQLDAFLIPDNVISSDQASKIVFTVADDGTVGTKKVELGPIVDGLRIVRSGLAPTDRIVIDGIQRARPGQKVTAEDGTIKAPGK